MQSTFLPSRCLRQAALTPPPDHQVPRAAATAEAKIPVEHFQSKSKSPFKDLFFLSQWFQTFLQSRTLKKKKKYNLHKSRNKAESRAGNPTCPVLRPKPHPC